MIDNFVLIIGAMKAGTTSLFEYLSQHPQISSCRVKEPCFFSLDRNWQKGWSWYEGLWDWDGSQHQIAMEGSTSYTRIPAYLNAAANISTMSAHFKFIYIVRDPIPRIESHYTYSYANGFAESQRPLAEGIDDRLIEATRYAKQIREYSQRFSQDDILVVPFAQLKADPLALTRHICTFIGVDPTYNFVNLDAVHNPAQNLIDDTQVWRSLRNVKSLKRLARYIPPQLKRATRQVFGGPINKNEFKLSDQQVEFVLSELRDDFHELQDAYGLDLSSWTLRQ